MKKKLVTIYATCGHLEHGQWQIPVRIWVKKRPDKVRRLAARAARRILRHRAGIESLDDDQKRLFMHRIEDFVTDSESRESVRFVFDKDPAGIQFSLTDANGRTKTDFNGLLSGTLSLSSERANDLLAAQQSTNRWLRLNVVSPNHQGHGYLQLIEPEGHSVISDIDDTIKVTNIPDGEQTVLTNTFFKPFKAAPSMARRYRALNADTVFHYVSGSPWQLYTPLTGFLWRDDVGFPMGSVHMKNVRTNPFESESYQDLWQLIGNGTRQATVDQKTNQISALLTRFEQRTFTLIGDSGEADPEVFSTIKNAFPEQVREILIRDIKGDASTRPARLSGMTTIQADAC